MRLAHKFNLNILII